jgi:glyoxylase-like metal-dependent hydrolase (beta-lactamase superfamily II)
VAEVTPAPLRPPDGSPPDVQAVRRDPSEARAALVAEGLWWLLLPLQYSRQHWVNAFLVERADGWCLVDCGSPLENGWEVLEHAMGLAGVRPDMVSLLLCTHAHTDHYGLATALMDAAGCPLAMAAGHTAGVDVMREPTVPFAVRRAMALAAGIPEEDVPQSTRAPGDDGYYPRPDPDVVLADGDLVEARHGGWRVVAAPGHAATQVVLLHEASRRLISADLVFAGRIPYVEHDYTPDPWLEHVESLARARALEPTLLLPGHGAPEPDALERIDACTAAIHRAPERILASVAAAERSPWEITVDVLGADAGFYPLHASLSGTLSVLRRLERLGDVSSAIGADGVRRYRPDIWSAR